MMNEDGTAITIVMIGLLIMFVFSLGAYIFYSWGEATYAQKMITEKLSAKAHEDAKVVLTTDNRLNVINRGGNVLVITGIIYDMGTAVYVENCFYVFGTLENRIVDANKSKLVAAKSVGVYTSLGNMFWVERRW